MAILRKAKCITLSLSGRGNKIFRNTDSSPFSENEVDNFDYLLKIGAIELVKSEKEVEDSEEKEDSKKGKKGGK